MEAHGLASEDSVDEDVTADSGAHTVEGLSPAKKKRKSR